MTTRKQSPEGRLKRAKGREVDAQAKLHKLQWRQKELSTDVEVAMSDVEDAEKEVRAASDALFGKGEK